MCGQAAPPLQLKVVTVKCSGLVKRRYERQNTELARQCAALQAQLKKEQLEVHALRRENLRLAGLVSQLERAAKAQQQRLNELKVVAELQSRLDSGEGEDACNQKDCCASVWRI